MANGNSNGLRSWGVQLISLVLALLFAFVAAPIWVESRIDSNVKAEAQERKDADRAIEERRKQQLDRIERKLDDIEKFIRNQ